LTFSLTTSLAAPDLFRADIQQPHEPGCIQILLPSTGKGRPSSSLARDGRTERLMPETGPHRIDVHHHLCPPDYLATVSRHQPMVPILAAWSLQKSLDDMAQAGVATAMLSIITLRPMSLLFVQNIRAKACPLNVDGRCSLPLHLEKVSGVEQNEAETLLIR
jgi:hypothetical protein